MSVLQDNQPISNNVCVSTFYERFYVDNKFACKRSTYIKFFLFTHSTNKLDIIKNNSELVHWTKIYITQHKLCNNCFINCLVWCMQDFFFVYWYNLVAIITIHVYNWKITKHYSMKCQKVDFLSFMFTNNVHKWHVKWDILHQVC